MPAAVTSYQVWLSIHILAAVLWVGTNFAIQLFFARMRPDADPRGTAQLVRSTEFFGNRVLAPLSLILIAMGFVLVSDGHWAWKFWLFFGIFVWAFSFVNGVGYLGRRAIPIAERLESDGYSASVAVDFARWAWAGRIEMTLLVLVVLDMALKPGA